MAVLHPFKAVRPKPDAAKDVASVPYDVVSVDEARQLADGKPRSFLHVVRPEIDLPVGVDEHDDSVYAKGAENLRAFVEADYTVADPASLYVYRLVMGGRSQTGIFGCVSVDDYDRDVILKHERTRPDKEDDRTRHIIEQRAHAEPVMLTFKDDQGIAAAIASTTNREPLISFTADDGVAHAVWRVEDAASLVQAFADRIDNLYVADGHHRCKAASRAADELLGKDAPTEARFFPAVLFPMSELRILAYNRVIRSLGMSRDAFAAKLRDSFDVRNDAAPVPAEAGQVSVYLSGAWYGLELPPTAHASVDAALDVARLGEHLLEPLLGITDPRRDPRIDFVGGIRGYEALERAVDSGAAELAISMYPTSIEELVAVSDAGLLMPPKSTWFEPKLRSGLLVHLF